MSFVAFRRRAVCACAIAIAATAVLSGSAIAGDAPASAGCPAVPTVQPFAPWEDLGDYFLAPGGDIEDAAAAWDLSGTAAPVAGNESFNVAGAGHDTSLSLPADSSATTAAFCIGIEHRTMRFFLRGPSTGVVHVDAVYAKRTDMEKSVRLASVAAGTTWAPSPIVAMVVNEFAADHANALPVSLRFTPRGTGTWQIDDVFVDPYRRG